MRKKVSLFDVTFVLGRVLLSSLFILGGVNKLLNYAATLQTMRDVGLEPAEMLLPATIALELGAGLLLAIGRFFAAPAALVLAVLTIATNVFFHDFWVQAEPMRALQLSLFFKNVAIAGGLLALAGAFGQRSAQT